jgi:hypothetical protein
MNGRGVLVATEFNQSLYTQPQKVVKSWKQAEARRVKEVKLAVWRGSGV